MSLKTRLACGCSVVVLAIGFAGPASADDFVIDTPVTNQNGGNTIDGDDTLTITPSGSISTTGTTAVLATGDNNGIVNQGGVSATGFGAEGINVENNSSVNSSGSVATTGAFADGIDAEDGNTIDNSGTVTTQSFDSDGIDVENNNTVVNSGSVSTSGELAAGLDAMDNNTLTNLGTIGTTGRLAPGIEARDGNTIDNSNTISTVEVSAPGIVVRDGNTIGNSGTVSTTGVTSPGIAARDGNSVDNSGTVSTTNVTSPGITFQDGNTIANSGTVSTVEIASPGMFGRDNNSIDNSGTVSTDAALSPGLAVRDANTVTNSGSVKTSRIDSPAIAVFDGNAVRNSGTVETSGPFSVGILANDNNTEISNSGTVQTTGNESNAIEVNDDNGNVSNSGAITTTGFLSQGIRADDRNTVSHSGSITTSGRLSDGIDLDNRNVLTMSGTIDTSGVNADAIDMEDRNTVTVTGTILTTGASSNAIEADNRNTINISGKVVSAQASSIDILRNNAVNLSAPAFLGGAIIYGRGTDFTITTGRSHSVLWDFSDNTPNSFNVSGPVPWFYNTTTQQFATFDPTVFAANVDQLSEWTNILTNMLQGQLDGGASGAANSTFAFSSGGKGSRSAWVRGFGSTASFDAESYLHGYDYDIYGVAAGVDGYVRSNLKLGIFGGYYRGDMTADGTFVRSYDNNTDNWFAGVYGRKTHGNVMVDFNLVAGHQSVSQWRFVNDNLAPLGNGSATADYDAWYISPEVSVSGQVATVHGWSVKPAARLRYTYQSIDGYTETGSSANATVGGQDVQLAEGRLELGLERTTGNLDTRLFGGYLGRYSFGDDSVAVTLLNITNAIPIGVDDYDSLGYVGANLALNMSAIAAIKAGIVYTFGDGVQSVAGSGGVTVKF